MLNEKDIEKLFQPVKDKVNKEIKNERLIKTLIYSAVGAIIGIMILYH